MFNVVCKRLYFAFFSFVVFVRECLFPEDGEDDDDIYLIRPFPSMWNCRVFHPYGLDPFSGNVRNLQGFSRSLEILTYMRSEASGLGMHSGECFVLMFYTFTPKTVNILSSRAMA
jgi:hypothetical protein